MRYQDAVFKEALWVGSGRVVVRVFANSVHALFSGVGTRLPQPGRQAASRNRLAKRSHFSRQWPSRLLVNQRWQRALFVTR